MAAPWFDNYLIVCRLETLHGESGKCDFRRVSHTILCSSQRRRRDSTGGLAGAFLVAVAGCALVAVSVVVFVCVVNETSS